MKHLKKFESIRTSDKLSKFDDITGVFNDDLDSTDLIDNNDRFAPDVNVLKNSCLIKGNDKIIFTKVSGHTSDHQASLFFELSDNTKASFDLNFIDSLDSYVSISHNFNNIAHYFKYNGQYFLDNVIGKFESNFYMVVLKLLYYPTYEVNCKLNGFKLDDAYLKKNGTYKILESNNESFDHSNSKTTAYYHLTSTSHLKDILKNGLKTHNGKLYLCKNYKSAAILALSHAYDGFKPDAKNFRILEVKVPKNVIVHRDPMWKDYIDNQRNGTSSELMRVVKNVLELENTDLDSYFYITHDIDAKSIGDVGFPQNLMMKYYKKIRNVEI